MEHKGTQIIATNHLILRPFAMDDVKDFHKYIASDKRIHQYFLMPYSETEEKTGESVSKIISSYDEKKYWWAIELKETGEVLGQILAINQLDVFLSSEIGYCIGYDYWNKGYTTEALVAVIDYLHEVGYHRLVAGYITENPASRRVMEKANMNFEGIRKDEIFYRNQFFDVGYFVHIK